MIYIKIAGAILVIAASFGIGTTIGMYQTRRTEDIHDLLLLIGIINGNLAYSATEITDIIEQGAKKTKGGVSVWLADILDRLTMDYNETFEDKWLKSIPILARNSYLSESLICQVEELGKWLCYMDVDTQLKNLRLWEKNMEAEYEEQQMKARQINKVSRSLGLLGGILLVILIV